MEDESVARVECRATAGAKNISTARGSKQWRAWTQKSVPVTGPSGHSGAALDCVSLA